MKYDLIMASISRILVVVGIAMVIPLLWSLIVLISLYLSNPEGHGILRNFSNSRSSLHRCHRSWIGTSGTYSQFRRYARLEQVFLKLTNVSWQIRIFYYFIIRR